MPRNSCGWSIAVAFFQRNSRNLCAPIDNSCTVTRYLGYCGVTGYFYAVIRTGEHENLVGVSKCAAPAASAPFFQASPVGGYRSPDTVPTIVMSGLTTLGEISPRTRTDLAVTGFGPGFYARPWRSAVARPTDDPRNSGNLILDVGEAILARFNVNLYSVCMFTLKWNN